jgi:hypothetical protein
MDTVQYAPAAAALGGEPEEDTSKQERSSWRTCRRLAWDNRPRSAVSIFSCVCVLSVTTVLTLMWAASDPSAPTSRFHAYTHQCFSEGEPYDNAQKLERYLIVRADDTCVSMLDLGDGVQHIALRSAVNDSQFFHLINPVYKEFSDVFGQELKYIVPSEHIFRVEDEYPPPLDQHKQRARDRVRREFLEPYHGPNDYTDPGIVIPSSTSEQRMCIRWDEIVVECEVLTQPRQARKTYVFLGTYAYCMQYYTDLLVHQDNCRDERTAHQRQDALIERKRANIVPSWFRVF